MKNLRKCRDRKLVTTKGEEIIWCQNQSYHKTVFRKLASSRHKKKTNIYYQFTRLTNIRYQQIAKYEFWYCCIKLKYGENAALCNMGTDNFTVHIETMDIYIDVAKNFETKKLKLQIVKSKDN